MTHDAHKKALARMLPERICIQTDEGIFIGLLWLHRRKIFDQSAVLDTELSFIVNEIELGLTKREDRFAYALYLQDAFAPTGSYILDDFNLATAPWHIRTEALARMKGIEIK
jgi:hypothetical protein